MAFKSGESGNPTGRPKGAISRRTQLSKLLEPHAEELVNKAVELAKNGDVNALRLILERLIPKPREESIELNITQNALNSPQALLELSTKALAAATSGELTLEQSQKLFDLITSQSELIVLANFDSRVKEMEKILKIRPNSK